MPNPSSKTDWSFPAAMRDYFDNVQKSAAEFMAELKQLDDSDKLFFRKELARVGYQLAG